jgi:hypothetical protein
LFAKFVASVKALITTNQNLSMKRQECLDLHLFDSVEQAQNPNRTENAINSVTTNSILSSDIIINCL